MALPPETEGEHMPITPFLDGYSFDPETRRVMGVAFELARVALQLEDRGDSLNAILARRIVELAQEGERNPDLLCENVLKEFSERRSEIARMDDPAA